MQIFQVTHAFKDFRRTHQDKWEESHRHKFTRDQLDAFEDVVREMLAPAAALLSVHSPSTLGTM
ncbi:unnamed protein product [Choristocarpus tenellus]